MAEVLISFVDGEVIHASVEDLSFDLPILSVEIQSLDPNCELALFPLTSIRQIVVGDIEPAPSTDQLETWDKTAFHFTDGQVLRAWIAPDAELGHHGGVWRVVEPESDELRTWAIPYSALKGVYRLREWDSRSTRERRGFTGGVQQLAHILAERETHASEEKKSPRRPLMQRINRK